MYTKKNSRNTYKSSRRPIYKKSGGYQNSKGRNRGNVSQQYNKYLKLAKDTFSSGDRIQAEYYYQFTDHYYRLMLELGINLEDQESATDAKENILESVNLENNQDAPLDNVDKIEAEKNNEEEVDQSIESIPFMSEPVKKKRSRTSK